MPYPTVQYFTNPQYPSGVDLWRAITPAKLMSEHGYGAMATPLGTDLLAFKGKPVEVVVFNQRGATRPGSTRHSVDQQLRPRRILAVADCCDDPEPDRDSPLVQRRKIIKSGWSKGYTPSQLVIDHLQAMDLVTVNSEPMADIVKRYCRHVEVIPDLIATSLWNNTRPGTRPPQLTVGVAGGDTHGKDWNILIPVWKILADKYDWLHFVIVGEMHKALYESLPVGRRHHVGFTNILRYQSNYRWIDVGCAPLDDSKFNISKSPIKYYEYSMAFAATVASPMVYSRVVHDGVTGCLATTTGEWVNRISELVDEPRVRFRMIEKARQDVYENYALNRQRVERMLEVYEKHYRRVYGSHPEGYKSHSGRLTLPTLTTAIPGLKNDPRWS